MDPIVSPSKDSDDPIILESSPVKSKDAIVTGNASSAADENCPVNRTGDSKAEEKDITEVDNEHAKVHTTDENLPKESLLSDKASVAEVSPKTADENTEKDASLSETNNSSKSANTGSPKINVDKMRVSPTLADTKDVKRKRKTPR